MANDLMNELGNTYESNYAASALRASKWQNPTETNQNQGGYGSNEKNAFSEDMNNNNNNNNNESTAIPIDDLDDEFFQIRNELRNEISGIINNATSVKNLCGKYKLATTDEYNNIMTKIDTLIQKNTALTTQIKWRIEKEKRNLSETCDNMNSLKVREFNNLVMNFKNSCNIFSQALNEYDNTVKSEQIRQLSIVDVNDTLSEYDKNQLINSEDPEAVQKFIDEKYALTDATNDELLNRLTHLEQQHNGLIKVERSIKELRDLFNELNILIIQQQDLIDNIDQNVMETKELVQSGAQNLKKAEKHQKKTRKMMLIGIICCFIILLIIIIAATA